MFKGRPSRSKQAVRAAPPRKSKVSEKKQEEPKNITDQIKSDDEYEDDFDYGKELDDYYEENEDNMDENKQEDPDEQETFDRFSGGRRRSSSSSFHKIDSDMLAKAQMQADLEKAREEANKPRQLNFP